MLNEVGEIFTGVSGFVEAILKPRAELPKFPHSFVIKALSQ